MENRPSRSGPLNSTEIKITLLTLHGADDAAGNTIKGEPLLTLNFVYFTTLPKILTSLAP
jgi:hypothetical protein